MEDAAAILGGERVARGAHIEEDAAVFDGEDGVFEEAVAVP